MKRFDKIITKQGAGGLLKEGLTGTVLIVNGNDVFINVDGNGWHVKANEIELLPDTVPAKLIEYAYPSSTTATNQGFGKTGCWFVSLYESETSYKRAKILKYFSNKSQALEYANTLPNPFNIMHKYF